MKKIQFTYKGYDYLALYNTYFRRKINDSKFGHITTHVFMSAYNSAKTKDTPIFYSERI